MAGKIGMKMKMNMKMKLVFYSAGQAYVTVGVVKERGYL